MVCVFDGHCKMQSTDNIAGWRRRSPLPPGGNSDSFNGKNDDNSHATRVNERSARLPEMAAGGGKNCRRRPSDSLCLPAVSDRQPDERQRRLYCCRLSGLFQQAHKDLQRPIQLLALLRGESGQQLAFVFHVAFHSLIDPLAPRLGEGDQQAPRIVRGR